MMASRAIEYAEESFRCLFGEPRAFFEIPQRGGDAVRVVYVVYALCGSDRASLENALIRTLRALKEDGGEFLYWRNLERIVLSKIDGLYRIWARIAVLNKDLDPVVLSDAVKIEGESARNIDDE
jgi:hypothetical protein